MVKNIYSGLSAWVYYSDLKFCCDFNVGGQLPMFCMSPQRYEKTWVQPMSVWWRLPLSLLIRALPKEMVYLYSQHSHPRNVSSQIANPKLCITVIQNENIWHFLLTLSHSAAKKIKFMGPNRTSNKQPKSSVMIRVMSYSSGLCSQDFLYYFFFKNVRESCPSTGWKWPLKGVFGKDETKMLPQGLDFCLCFFP